MVSEKFESGFTWRSILAIAYSQCVFTPAIIWLSLVTLGVDVGGVIPFCVLLLFAEFARISGRPLTKHEAAVIFGSGMTTMGVSTFMELIHKAWFVRYPLLKAAFNINPLSIPTWWAPPATSLAFDLRTFIHPDMLKPLILVIVTWLIGTSAALFFALFLRETFIEGERLPFPIQQISVGAVESLTERLQERLDVLAWSAVISLIYAALMYTVPTISTAAGFSISMIPIPWLDLSRIVQVYVPGIAFGVATDLMILSQGFVLPTNVIIGMLIGSASRFLIVNPMLVNYGWTEWAHKYVTGMDVTQIFQYSTLYFWLNPIIGAGFAVGTIPILLRARTFASSLKSLLRLKSASTGERISGPPFSPFILLALFITGCGGFLVLHIMLVPDFPFWILAIYDLILPFVIGLAQARILGITGQSMQVPYLNQLTVYAGTLTGYNKIDAWFLPLGQYTGIWWLSNLKMCQLTKTSITSWIKAVLIIYPLSLISSFIFTSVIWQLSPIPSALFPTPMITWPIQAMSQAVWITRPELYFDLSMIIYAFLTFAALTTVVQLANLPFSAMSIVAGLSLPTPIALTITIGLIFGRLISHIFGKEWFNKYRITMAAGIALGEGLAIVIGVTTALVVKSVFIKPY